MVVVPADIPATTPPDIVPTAVFVLLHIPLPAASLKGVLAPTQTKLVPDILPAAGDEFTVTTLVAATTPQLLLTV